jgi:predicted nucleic acid-binding Zn ribbon protein
MNSLLYGEPDPVDTDECLMCGETIHFGEQFCSIDCKTMYHYGE